MLVMVHMQRYKAAQPCSCAHVLEEQQLTIASAYLLCQVVLWSQRPVHSQRPSFTLKPKPDVDQHAQVEAIQAIVMRRQPGQVEQC